jgi:hypothetical protein
MKVKSSVKLLCVFERYIFLYAGKGGVSTVLIIAIVIPIAVSIALFSMCFCFLRRARKTRDYVPENDGKEH